MSFADLIDVVVLDDGDNPRELLTINGVGNGITITGGGSLSNSKLLNIRQSELSLIISNLTITEFRSDRGGGAIFSYEAVTVINSTFRANESYDADGGAIYSRKAVEVNNSTFSDNKATGGSGGAIYSQSAVEVSNSTFSGNEGTNGGGFSSDDTPTVTNSTFSGNIASRDGGGFRSGENATVTNSTFSGNIASRNGGGFRSGENATVTNSTFSGNTAADDGGGFRSGETATVTNSTFSGNTAADDGGGFRSIYGATVTNSTFSGNTAADDGGGFRSGEDANVTNSTFIGNSARDGGAVRSFYYSSFTNSIFSGNIASRDGGAIFSYYGGDVTYSIFNTNDTFSYDDRGVSKNLPLPGRTGVIVGDPLLGALQNNGGSTLTMLPGAGSPAIDSGTNFSVFGVDFDQRGTGFPRIFNGTVDMGAVEVQSFAASGGASWDGIGVNSLTSVLLQDQSGLDSDWSDHDIFLSALSNILKEKPNSELKVLADGSVKLTAFLPTDRAFRKLAFDLTGIRPRNDKATMRVIESLDLETIEKVLLYHVVLGDPIGSSDALKANGLTLTTLSGETFSVRVTKRPNIFLRDINKNLRNPKVLLKRVDINSGNRQVAHVINRVLIPVEDIK